ncbi:MAG: HEPN domain-containing protein [Phycisphaeraceae bacterium]|nr:HEPN domain-containing protein [Phycisphaeraceae bacterium]
MTPQEARAKNVEFLAASARDALDSARAELAARRTRFAVNRAYYACFYAVSAVLLADKRHYVKHKGVKSGLHEFLILPGRLSVQQGRFYDALFAARHKADYAAMVIFDPEAVVSLISDAEKFVADALKLLPQSS